MAFVDPRALYSKFYSAGQGVNTQGLIPDFDPTGKISDPSGAKTGVPAAGTGTGTGTGTGAGTGAGTGTGTGGSGVGNFGTYGTSTSGAGFNPLWTKFLGLIGAGSTGNPEAAKDWSAQSGKFWRNRARGMELFGLAPQDIYWQNLQGSGSTVDDWLKQATAAEIAAREAELGHAIENNTINPASWWSAYQNQSAGMPQWLQDNLAALSGVWGQLSDPEQQQFRDRLLLGTGLPAYLQAFLKARPQWITDYISKNFVV